jgi:hypothetical protein
MSIDDMTTAHMNAALAGGLSIEFGTSVSTWVGVGGGAELTMEVTDSNIDILAKANLAVSTDRISSSHYEYSFTFAYDFSTSADPNLAGHPSDVIIGGGLDLIVSEAIKGLFIHHVIFPLKVFLWSSFCQQDILTSRIRVSYHGIHLPVATRKSDNVRPACM